MRKLEVITQIFVLSLLSQRNKNGNGFRWVVLKYYDWLQKL